MLGRVLEISFKLGRSVVKPEKGVRLVADEEVLIRRAEVVRIHLDQLEESLRRSKPGPAEAVYASMALRFLFDGHVLGQVGYAHGVPITVPAPDLDGVPIDQALFFACGGYRIGEGSVSPHYVYREPGVHSPIRRSSSARSLHRPAIILFGTSSSADSARCRVSLCWVRCSRDRRWCDT